MLSIDEAIAKHRKIAETQKTLYDACVLKECNKHFLRKAEEHEQLAEWLEELKAYKEIGTVEGYKSAIECYTKEYLLRRNLQDQIKEQYNKAIDDCKELTFREVVYCDSLNDRTEFRELAEQLKESDGE